MKTDAPIYECKEVSFFGGLESKFCLWLLRRHNRRVSAFLINGSKGRNPTEWNRPLEEVIECHAVKLAIYDRVCGEAQEKPWGEIDQGLKGNIGGPKVWKAYMTTTLIGGLRDIVYRHRRNIE